MQANNYTRKQDMKVDAFPSGDKARDGIHTWLSSFQSECTRVRITDIQQQFDTLLLFTPPELFQEYNTETPVAEQSFESIVAFFLRKCNAIPANLFWSNHYASIKQQANESYAAFANRYQSVASHARRHGVPEHSLVSTFKLNLNPSMMEADTAPDCTLVDAVRLIRAEYASKVLQIKLEQTSANQNAPVAPPAALPIAAAPVALPMAVAPVAPSAAAVPAIPAIPAIPAAAAAVAVAPPIAPPPQQVAVNNFTRTVVCWMCNTAGHIAANCPNRYNNSNSGNFAPKFGFRNNFKQQYNGNRQHQFNNNSKSINKKQNFKRNFNNNNNNNNQHRNNNNNNNHNNNNGRRFNQNKQKNRR